MRPAAGDTSVDEGLSARALRGRQRALREEVSRQKGNTTSANASKVQKTEAKAKSQPPQLPSERPNDKKSFQQQLLRCFPSMGLDASSFPTSGFTRPDGSQGTAQERICLQGRCIGVLCKDKHRYMENIRFEEGIIEIKGSKTRVHMKNVCFQECTLLISEGATVTMDGCHFQRPPIPSMTPEEGIIVLVKGKGTSVVLRDCRMQGGVWGLLVTDDCTACVENLVYTDVQARAICVIGKNTRFEMTGCTVKGPTGPLDPIDSMTEGPTGLHIGGGPACSIEGCEISGFQVGLAATGSHVTLTRCKVLNCTIACCTLGQMLSAELKESRFEGSEIGVAVQGFPPPMQPQDTHTVSMTSCCFVRNTLYGMSVSEHGCSVELHRCTGKSNAVSFSVADRSTLRLMDCCSTSATHAALLASSGASAVSERMAIDMLRAACTGESPPQIGPALVGSQNATLRLVDSSIHVEEGRSAAWAAESACMHLMRCTICAAQTAGEDNVINVMLGLVMVGQGASLTAEDVVLQGSRNAAFVVQDKNSSAELHRCQVTLVQRSTHQNLLLPPSVAFPAAISVMSGARAAIYDTTLSGGSPNVAVGGGPGTLCVAHTSSFLDSDFCGVDLSEGGHFEMNDCLVSAAIGYGIHASGPGTVALINGGMIERCGGMPDDCQAVCDASFKACLQAQGLHARYNGDMASNTATFSASYGGVMYLSDCVCEDPNPYLQVGADEVEPGGAIVTERCVPENHALATFADLAAVPLAQDHSVEDDDE